MRPKGTAAELERRRRRAVELLEQGEVPAVVARILGVQRTSLHRWRRMARQTDGLAAQPPSGAKRRLGEARLTELEQLLSKGATVYGFPNELWTPLGLPNSSSVASASRITPDRKSVV